MSQIKTGRLTEGRVKRKLESLGLIVRKPIPDRGIDLEAWLPTKPDRVVKIQVKGRNPSKVTSLRWFQIRVSKVQLETARCRGADAASTWREKLAKCDFLVLDAVGPDESWVLSISQALELIRLNESRNANRPDNIFNYDAPLKDKQKEMNLDIEVDGVVLTKRFRNCLENFEPIREFLLNRNPGTAYS